MKRKSFPKKQDTKVPVKTIFEAAKEGDLATVTKLIESDKIDVNSKDALKKTPLHHAAIGGNVDVIDYLIKHGAEVDAMTKDKDTPLQLAVVFDHFPAASKLLEHKADPNSKDHVGTTSMHLAAENVNLDMIKLLVEFGGDLNTLNEYNSSVMHSAASGIINGKENWDVISWLVREGANTNSVNILEHSPRDILSSKDWSYAELFDEVVKKAIGESNDIVQ